MFGLNNKKKQKDKKDEFEILTVEELQAEQDAQVRTDLDLIEKEMTERGIDEEDEYKPKKLVKTSKILVEKMAGWITKGELDQPDAAFSYSQMTINTEHSTKHIFQIIKFPVRVKVGYGDSLREELKAKFPDPEEAFQVELIVNTSATLKRISKASRKINANKDSVVKGLRRLEEEMQRRADPLQNFIQTTPDGAWQVGIDPYLKSSLNASAASQAEMDHMQERKLIYEAKLKSFDAVFSYQDRGGTCEDVYIFLEVTAPKKELSDRAAAYMREILKSRKYVYREITGDQLEQQQKYFGIGSLKTLFLPKGIKATFSPTVVDIVPLFTTSFITASGLGFRPGIIRNDYPEMYLGNNIDNNYRVDIRLTSGKVTDRTTGEERYLDDGKANNWLYLAQTGSGKSATLAISLLTLLDNPYIDIVINDYKGNEWSRFRDVVGRNATTISADPAIGKYVNTYKIPYDDKFGFKNPHQAYDQARRISIKSLFALTENGKICPRKETMVKEFCNSIVDRVYRKAGVIDSSPITYENSMSISFVFDTWRALDDLMKDPEALKPFDEEIPQMVRKRLSIYFSPDAVKRSMFREEITLQELMSDKRCIIFDANALGVNGDIPEEERNFSFIQRTHLTRLFAAVNKEKGRYTVIVTEEAQNYLENDEVLQEILIMCQSGRSQNIINMLIMNATKQYFTATSRENPNIADLRKNITVYAIGKCDIGMVGEAIEALPGLVHCKEMLTKISASAESKYKHTFLYHNTNHQFETVACKMPVPKSLIDELLTPKTVIEVDEF